MSDTEFWRSTPAKIFALLDYHSSVENPDKDKLKEQELEKMPRMTPDMIQKFGGRVIKN